MRIDVKIPGGVNAYLVDLRGERCVIDISKQNMNASIFITTLLLEPEERVVLPAIPGGMFPYIFIHLMTRYSSGNFSKS